MLTIQYLEDSPDLPRLNQEQVVLKLRAAAERLPITHLLIGWHLPTPLLEACRMEAECLGIRFLLWQPLLTGDNVFHPEHEWRVVGLTGHQGAGYRDLPEFTFVCPNHPAVQEATRKHIEDLVRQGLYQGFFMDRVRFPSPSADPTNDLTCFCEHCQRKAAEDGLDLEQIRALILHTTLEENGRISLVKALLTGKSQPGQAEPGLLLDQFLAFRKKSIRDFLAIVSHRLREAHLEIGLDCFSPTLTHMVGQDLAAMSKLVDWIKLMTYAHTLAPAGIPFELSGLFRYLTSTTHLSDVQVLDIMGQSTGLDLPTRIRSLEKYGLSSPALEMEVKRGLDACSVPALVGLELVELEGVTELRRSKIEADLTAIKRAGPAGLALSWDLLYIPMERLDLVRQVYL